MPESDALWAVCKKFNLLPSDPRLSALEPIQLLWILGNIISDNEKEAEAYGNGSTESLSMDAEDFESMLKNRKA